MTQNTADARRPIDHRLNRRGLMRGAAALASFSLRRVGTGCRPVVADLQRTGAYAERAASRPRATTCMC